jgi:hypothetical protein
MPTFLLCHQHDAATCRFAFAAWRGYASPLRRRPALASCLTGGHAVWWTVEVADREAALSLLPPYVASRTRVVAVREVVIP